MTELTNDTAMQKILAGLSVKTVVLIIVGIVLIYGGIKVATGTPIGNLFSGGVTSNKIICKPNQAVVNGACIDVGPCGLLPTTNSNCNISALICDPDIGNEWRCPLPCESPSNPVPNGIGSCGKLQLKCDKNGLFYCPNDISYCSGNGGLYPNFVCSCNSDSFGQYCDQHCPTGKFIYNNNTCMPILQCLNGTFDMLHNTCICNTGYYLNGTLCLVIPNCTNGSIFNTVTQKCVCNSPQYYGTLCENNCGTGNYYINGNCTNLLTCNNTGTFNLTSHACSCASGYSGLTCDFNRYNCSNHGNVVLNTAKGFGGCSCDNGWYGPYCNVSAGICKNNGIPQFDTNGKFTGCLCPAGYAGKYCQLSGADYCHSYGTPIADSNDNVLGCTNCDSAHSAGLYCCPTPVPSTTDTCLYGTAVCSSSSNTNRGWTIPPKTASAITNTAGWNLNNGVCAMQHCPNYSVTGNYILSLGTDDVTKNPKVICQKACPTTFTCSGCSSTLTGTPGETVCGCDSSTNYNPSCMQVQSSRCVLQNGGSYPKGLCKNGTPTCVNCSTQGDLWHCDGYNPSVTDPTYANSLKSCISAVESISNPGSYYTSSKAGLPVFPTIDNEVCKQWATSASPPNSSYDINDFDPSHQGYWNLFNNPASNIMSVSNGTATLLSRREGGYDKNKWLLYNAYRDGSGNPHFLPNVLFGSDGNSANQGCFQDISGVCQNGGTFVQTTSPNPAGGTGTNPGTYMFNEGTCICPPGFAGNKCQYSNTVSCTNRGSVSSPSSGKNALVADQANNYICSCNNYTSTADGRSKAYLGNQCQYDDNSARSTSGGISGCNGRGKIDKNNTCTCNYSANGVDCLGNKCEHGGTSPGNGTTCTCVTAWSDGGLCSTSQCRNGSTPNNSGTCDCPFSNGQYFLGNELTPKKQIYSGDLCDVSKCHNGGTAVIGGEFPCDCPAHYSDRGYCDNIQCYHDGTVKADGTCSCKAPYYGTECQNTDSCACNDTNMWGTHIVSTACKAYTASCDGANCYCR